MEFPPHLEKAIVEKHLLVGCQFELTYKCNEACVHCYQRVGRRLVYPKGVVAAADDLTAELRTDEVLRILDELRAEGCLLLALTGGDPLVRRDFRQIAQYANDLGFVITVMTNALRIDESMADFLAQLNLMRVEVSLYGARAATHDLITQVRGSFDKTLAAVRRMVDRGMPVYLKFQMTRPAFEELDEARALADSFEGKIDFVTSPELVPRNDGSLDVLKWSITDEQMRELFRRELAEPQGDVVMPRGVEAAEQRISRHAEMCGIGDYSIDINPLGHVYVCVSLPFVCGDLRKQSLREIWHGSGFFRHLKTLRDSDLEGSGTSANRFRCPGASYVESGDVTALSGEARRMGALWDQCDNELVQIGLE